MIALTDNGKILQPESSALENSIQKITAFDIAQKTILNCKPDMSLYAAAKLMSDKKFSSIIIVNDANESIGIWTERDALEIDFMSQGTLNKPISQFMSSPVKVISHDALVDDIGMKFKLDGIRHLLVVDDFGNHIGIISQSDIILNKAINTNLLSKPIGSLLHKPLLVLSDGSSLNDASVKMRMGKTDAVAIKDSNNRCVGIVTERDILKTIANKNITLTLNDIASKPIKTISQQSSLQDAHDMFKNNNIRHVGVIDASGCILGILSFSNILDSMEQQYFEELHSIIIDRDEALRTSTANLQLAQKVIEVSLDAIMITNKDSVIEYVNKAFTELTGYTPDEAIGNTPSILNSGRQDKEFYENLWDKIKTEGSWCGEIWNRRKNGEIFPERLTITAIFNDNGSVSQYAAIFSDISDRKGYESKIEKLAYYDTLTKLPNRRLFNDRLEQTILNAKRSELNPAILFLDIDNFKRINDTFGHSIGDKILEKTAQRLLSCIRDGDSVSRLGGDEFVILLQGSDDAKNAAKLACRVIEEMVKPLYLDDKKFFLTVSIGVAIFPYDGKNSETLFKNADTAMYKAKEHGRNNFQLYTSAMNEKFYSKLILENLLRNAIENDQFHMVYQPKINLKSDGVHSFEALARWEHPERGLIPPSEFIPLAEELGLIIQLEDIFFRKVCDQWCKWIKSGISKQHVAVNISLYHFNHANMANKLLNIAKEAGLDTNYLEIEITESTFTKEIDMVVKELNILRDQGITVAIDDFGTGYSSFGYLKKIPANILKIDKSFIEEITTSHASASIVSAIIAMAHQLELLVVAEGVENKEELLFLRQHDCDLIQGYIFSKPLKGEDVVNRIKSKTMLPYGFSN